MEEKKINKKIVVVSVLIGIIIRFERCIVSNSVKNYIYKGVL